MDRAMLRRAMNSRLVARAVARSSSRSRSCRGQVDDLLLEVGDLLVEGVDVGRSAEPELAPGGLAEGVGEPTVQVLESAVDDHVGQYRIHQGGARSRRMAREMFPPAPAERRRPRIGLSDQLKVAGPADRLAAVRRRQLATDVLDVGFDGVGGNVQLGGDLGGGQHA